MARTLISENEKFEILNKHNNFKKILENELKHLNRGLVSEQTLPTGQVSDPLLAAASKAGCINNGSITMFEGKPVYMKKAKKDLSPKFAIGDTLVLYNDYSYWVFPQAGTSRKGPYKWSCPEINASIEQQNKTNIERTEKEGGWKQRKDITDTDENVENPQMYEKKVINGQTRYRRKASSSIGSALTDDQEKIINKWTAQGYKFASINLRFLYSSGIITSVILIFFSIIVELDVNPHPKQFHTVNFSFDTSKLVNY